MSRPPRPQFPGALYHVTSRGNNRRPLFADDRDRELVLFLLDEVVGRYAWRCYAYCLMTNHFHFLLETPEPNIAEGMRVLNARYARGFNRRHGRVGHLFERRYHTVVIERQGQLLEVARYVVLNPVRAGICERAEDYRWSSYAATAGHRDTARFLAVNQVLRLFGGDPVRARERYAGFVAEGAPAASLEGLLLPA